jgi:uncharacterized protein YwqG
MNDKNWMTLYKQFELPTNKMTLRREDVLPHPVTQVGGIPWWPVGTGRPKCDQGHLMSFIAQINLKDLPSNESALAGLLSFHYCIQCQYDGNMAFGWDSDEKTKYDVRVFSELSWP